MHLNNYVKTTIFGLVCLLSSIALVPTADAFPTVDFGNIAKKVQSGVTQVQQKVKMVTQCKAVTQINNAIGKAKSMAAMAQSKAEELKKKAEKIKKIQEEAKKKLEKVKELKKKYEEQKAKLEAYQQKIKEQADKAKKAVNDAKNKVNEVKDKVNEAKNKVNEIKDKVNEAKDKVNAIKDQATSKINAVQNMATGIQNKVSSATSALGGATSALSGATSASKGSSAVSGGEYTNQSSSVSTKSLQTGTKDLSAEPRSTQTTIFNQSGSTALTPMSGSTSLSASGTKGRVGFTQGTSDDLAASDDYEDDVEITGPVMSFYARSGTGNHSDNEALSSAEKIANPTLSGEKSLSKTVAPATKSTVKTSGATKGQSKTQTTSAATTKVLKSTPKTIFTSPTASASATMAAPTEIAAPTAAPAEISAPIIPSEGTVEDEDLSEAEENIKEIEDVANEEGSFAALRTLKQTMTEAIRKGDTKTLGAIADMDTAKVVNSNSKIYEPTAKKTTGGRKAFTISPSKTDKAPAATSSKEPAKITPAKTLQKNSSLWLDDGEFARQNSIKVSHADTLKFATEASDCSDFDYKMVVEANGQVTDMLIMSKLFAQTFCLKPEDLKDMNVIPDAIKKLSTDLTSEDETVRKETAGIIADMQMEQAENANVEALLDKTISASYKEDVLSKLYDTVKNVEDNNSGISNIAIANVQLVYLMNRVRNIYATSLITAGMGAIDTATKEILDPETDIGLDNDSDKEYDYQVAHADAEVAINFPIMPENLARKCEYTVGSDPSVIKTCYQKVFQEQYNKETELTSRAFIDQIQYSNMINILATGFFQKVKSAEYEQGIMKQTKEAAQDASDAHKGKEALVKGNKEMIFVLDDIIKGYASRIAYNGLTTLTKLMPVGK